MYLPKEARFSHLLNFPEGANIGGAINEANELESPIAGYISKLLEK
jgi:hypothetical protein